MLTPPSLPKGWRIIATDDNTSKLSALTETPRAAGHCEFAAYDGESALEQLSLPFPLSICWLPTRAWAPWTGPS